MKDLLINFCNDIHFSSCNSESSRIVDYSRSSNNETAVSYLCSNFDLEGLNIANPSGLTVTAAIFDDHCFQSDGSDQEHCEAILFPENGVMDKWLMFVELKYSERVGGYGFVRKAFNQVFNTVKIFRENQIISQSKVVFGIICFPIAKQKPPFTSFTFTPSELRSIRKENNIIIETTNSVTVVSEKVLWLR